jgi:2-polyprenyl-3-methyl-5-hydroxy-6-metoxy-1,4-benzoquinol methylase
MSLFRITHTDFEQRFDFTQFDTEHASEWDDVSRIHEPSWVARYEYEANIVQSIIEDNSNIKSVLELGSGPGALSQLILQKNPELVYHLVDKPFAKKHFDAAGYKGTFFVKDLSNGFDPEGLLDSYDLVITNDFLEHVFNPHSILTTIRQLTHPDSVYLVSNPNWRMSHQFIYRGLFDFDNLIYMLYTHGFGMEGLYGSPLKTQPYPKIDSETLLPDEHLTDWNHYMVFKHRTDMRTK